MRQRKNILNRVINLPENLPFKRDKRKDKGIPPAIRLFIEVSEFIFFDLTKFILFTKRKFFSINLMFIPSRY